MAKPTPHYGAELPGRIRQLVFRWQERIQPNGDYDPDALREVAEELTGTIREISRAQVSPDPEHASQRCLRLLREARTLLLAAYSSGRYRDRGNALLLRKQARGLLDQAWYPAREWHNEARRELEAPAVVRCLDCSAVLTDPDAERCETCRRPNCHRCGEPRRQFRDRLVCLACPEGELYVSDLTGQERPPVTRTPHAEFPPTELREHARNALRRPYLNGGPR